MGNLRCTWGAGIVSALQTWSGCYRLSRRQITIWSAPHNPLLLLLRAELKLLRRLARKRILWIARAGPHAHGLD